MGMMVWQTHTERTPAKQANEEGGVCGTRTPRRYGGDGTASVSVLGASRKPIGHRSGHHPVVSQPLLHAWTFVVANDAVQSCWYRAVLFLVNALALGIALFDQSRTTLK